MKRDDLIDQVAQNLKVTKRTAGAIVEAFLEALKAGLAGEDGRVVIQGFGSFTAKDMPAKRYHNPAIGKRVEAPPYRKVWFRASKLLNQALNADSIEAP